jgi:hypothetical protein
LDLCKMQRTNSKKPIENKTAYQQLVIHSSFNQ